MVSEFFLVLCVAGFGALAAILMLLIPYFFAPRKYNPVKSKPFECGQVPQGTARVSLMMQYYAYLLMFVVFDVIVMFLFAWAVSYSSIGFQGSLFIIIFLLIVLVPMSYTLRLAGKKEIW